MSDTPQGPGWWQASDGKYYGPESHPDPAHRAQYAAPPAAAPPAASTPTGNETVPIQPMAQPPAQTPATPPAQPQAAPPQASPPQAAPPQTPAAPPAQPQAAPPQAAPPAAAPPAATQFPTPGGEAPPWGADAPPAAPAAPGPDAWGQPPAAPQAFAGAPSAGGYPARLTAERSPTIARWRVFLHGIMAIPHFIVGYVLGAVAGIVAVLAWFAILFTGKMPEGFHNLISMSLRYYNRVIGYLLFFTEEYPPFAFETTAHDATPYPIRSDYDYNPGPRNRVTSFFRYFMVIPHMIVLALVFIGAYIAYIIGWFAVLFTGKLPDGIANFLLGVGRWVTRVYAYFYLLTDEYPPFSLD